MFHTNFSITAPDFLTYPRIFFLVKLFSYEGGGVLYYAPVLACVTTTPENVNIVGIYQYISRPNVHYISVEISRHYLVLCAGRCQSTNNIENISRCNNAHVRPTYYTTQLAYIAEHLLYAVGINPLDRTHSWRIPQFTWLGPLRRKIQTCPVRLISHKTCLLYTSPSPRD